MNHSWENNKCKKCGVVRVMKSWSQTMAVVDHPPWELVARGRGWYYGVENTDGLSVRGIGFKRPDCLSPSQSDKQK